MPVPTLITDLSTTPASNSPAGSENVFPSLDDYLRSLSSFVASIRSNSATNGWVSPYLPLTGGTLTGPVTFSSVAGDGSGLTGLSAAALSTGTIPAARFPATLPAVSGAQLTSLNAAQLMGNIDPGRLTNVPGASLTGSVQAGLLTGDVAVARLIAAFGGTNVGAPYIVMPNGIIIQWGRVNYTNNFFASYSVTFPIAFPNLAGVVISNPTGGSGGFNISGATSFNASGATINVSNRDPGSGTGTGVIHWIAVGY